VKVKYTKFEVEIGSNGHIKLNGNVIAIMGQWNKYEDIKLPTKRKK
tara:strand:+ start:1806 stop:1943 length:138 start_codon:yes stop_codon:yes gene_type:complete